MSPADKIPVSALVVVYTPELRVLLIERVDHPGYWQSVTGSQHRGETLDQTAVRELFEETAIDATRYGGVADWHLTNVFEIYAKWQTRYPRGTTHNAEHVFGLQVPASLPVTLAPREHRDSLWLPWREAAAKCFSWSNRAAIEDLPRIVGAGELV